MRALLADGFVLDAILAAMVLEACGLAALHRLTGRGVAPAAYLLNLCSGLCLLLAMRLALGGAWWGYVSSALLGALCLHLGDLWRQWRRAPAHTARPRRRPDAGSKSF